MGDKERTTLDGVILLNWSNYSAEGQRKENHQHVLLIFLGADIARITLGTLYTALVCFRAYGWNLVVHRLAEEHCQQDAQD